MQQITIAQIRRALIAKFGERQYRITRDGDIHVHGRMPNTNIDGWYLYGWIHDDQTLYSLGLIS